MKQLIGIKRTKPANTGFANRSFAISLRISSFGDTDFGMDDYIKEVDLFDSNPVSIAFSCAKIWLYEGIKSKGAQLMLRPKRISEYRKENKSYADEYEWSKRKSV